MLFSIEGKSVVIMGTAELRSLTSSLRVLPFLNTCRVIFHLTVLRVSKRLRMETQIPQTWRFGGIFLREGDAWNELLMLYNKQTEWKK